MWNLTLKNLVDNINQQYREIRYGVVYVLIL